MSRYSQSTLDQATQLSNQIRSMGVTDEVTDGLQMIKKAKSQITLAEDTITERVFVAAEDLYDGANKIYGKGDTIDSGTIVKGDWQVIETLDEENFNKFELDNPTDTTPITNPDEIDVIDNGPDTTTTGMSNEVDGYMNQKYADATEWLFGYCSDGGLGFSCTEGDDLSCLGHLWDSDRQNAIVLSSIEPVDPELVAPAMAQYNNIDKFGESISKFRMTAIAANGNEFVGSFLVNYNDTYMDINERINLFINDMTTGLESVGIHLSGEDSKITLVGSVDLKQHSATSRDTLNVYDNVDVKRVEITPLEIPKRGTAETGIDVSTPSFNYIQTYKTANKSYVEYNSWKDWDGPFWYSWVYSYFLKGYSVDLTTTANLGYIKAGSQLDLSKLHVHFSADTYVNGMIYTSDHSQQGTYKQAVTTLCYTLKRDGNNVSGKYKVDLLNNPGLSINGINTDDIAMEITGTFLDDYTITTSGTYSLEINVVVNVIAYRQTGNYYENYYYKIDSRLRGDVTTSVARATSSDDDISSRKLTIGTNGMAFYSNNSRYFYAATDGYEIKCDDASIMVDQYNGIRVNKLYTVVSSQSSINKKYDVVIANYSSNGYYIYLPDAQEFGNGRIMTIIAFQGLKVRTSGTDTIRLPIASGITESQTLEFGNQTISSSITMPKYQVQLISANAGWYITAYF